VGQIALELESLMPAVGDDGLGLGASAAGELDVLSTAVSGLAGATEYIVMQLGRGDVLDSVRWQNSVTRLQQDSRD
jgi:hypothetical protein